MSDFLSVDEFAARLKISRSTLYELVKQKRIAHLRIGDRIRMTA
jgi:excisionase family DNA binding protein